MGMIPWGKNTAPGAVMTMPALPTSQAATADTTLPAIVQAVAALPALGVDTGRYGLRHLTAVWLAEQGSPHTRREYFKDLTGWLGWCEHADLDPLQVRPADVGTYRAYLAEVPSPATGRPLAASTIARRLAALSSWYKHLMANDAADRNPVAAAKRPRVDRDATTTVGLTFGEVCALLDRADLELREAVTALDMLAASGETNDRKVARAQAAIRVALRARALLRLLAETGLRIGEALQLDVDSLSHNQGYRTIRYVGKRGARRERAIEGHTVAAIGDYLDDRSARGLPRTGPLFATERRDGSLGRWDEPAVFRLIRRLALHAKIKSARRLSPHSLRHAFATMALHELPLHEVQDSMGHADPRTTQRYNRARNSLARDASLTVGRRFAARATTPVSDVRPG